MSIITELDQEIFTSDGEDSSLITDPILKVKELIVSTDTRLGKLALDLYTFQMTQLTNILNFLQSDDPLIPTEILSGDIALLMSVRTHNELCLVDRQHALNLVGYIIEDKLLQKKRQRGEDIKAAEQFRINSERLKSGATEA